MVSTALAYASTSILHLWFCITCIIACNDLIFHDNLLVGGAVLRRRSSPPRYNHILLWQLMLYFDLCMIGGRKPWRLSTYWVGLVVVTITWCHHWTLPFVPKRLSLLTPSWHCQSSAPLLLYITAPFRVGPWDGQGVLQGHMAPSSWWCFLQVQFSKSTFRTWRDVVASLGSLLSQILSTDQS